LRTRGMPPRPAGLSRMPDPMTGFTLVLEPFLNAGLETSLQVPRSSTIRTVTGRPDRAPILRIIQRTGPPLDRGPALPLELKTVLERASFFGPGIALKCAVQTGQSGGALALSMINKGQIIMNDGGVRAAVQGPPKVGDGAGVALPPEVQHPSFQGRR